MGKALMLGWAFAALVVVEAAFAATDVWALVPDSLSLTAVTDVRDGKTYRTVKPVRC